MKKTVHQILTAAACLAAALCAGIALAACTDDTNEPATGGHDRTPLVFTAAVHGMPATTRSNTAASQWTDGDEVAVEMDGVVKKYIIKAAAGATASLSPADAANTHFWPDLNQPVTVRAWRYGDSRPHPDPNDEFYIDQYPWDRKPDAWSMWGAQDMTDNNGEFRYQQNDFLYAPEQSVSYDATAGIGLTFYHQTARVEVRIRKAGLVKDDNKGDIRVFLGNVPNVSLEILTEGTFDASQIDPGNGEFSGLTANETTEKKLIIPKPMSGTPPEGYARCYEALFIPQNMDGKHLICVGVGDKYYYYKPADGEADLRGGYTYTYDITVSEHGRLDVTVGKPIAGWVQQEGGSGTVCELIDLANPPVAINDNGAYLLTGSARNKTINITGGNPTVIVKDFYSEGGIHITGGTPEIRVEGTNNLIIGNEVPAIWLDGDNANVRITGDGITESELSLGMQALGAPAAIGTHGPNGASVACGNIEISNLALGAGTISFDRGGAVIGTGGGEGNRKCGDITITDASVIAKSSIDAAAIGFGGADPYTDMTDITYEMGNITITNSTIESTIVPINGTPAHIGSGAKMAENYIIGEIRITTDKSGTEFFEKFNGGTKAGDEVIVGFPGAAKPWNVLWRTDILMSILWDNVPGLLQLP